MFFIVLLSHLIILLTVPCTVLSQHDTNRPKARTVVYWGQSGGGVIDNNNLASYCTPDSGIDVIVLAFLYQYGNGITIPSGTFGQNFCSVDTSGNPSNCDDLSSSIAICKSKGVKIILSLGGASGAYSLSSQQEAETIGQNLWDAYGAGNGTIPRPFGSNVIDGWDFDIEASSGNQYYQYLIKKLRSNFNSGDFVITGAPQCPIPEPNMQQIITTSQFDYLWVQFYNNPCSVNSNINFNDWVSNVANTPSAKAKIFIGVPASPRGATGTDSGAQYYLEPSALNTLVGQYKTNHAFGGIMMWAAGFSDNNIVNGCTYAQQAHHILQNGSPCESSRPINATNTTLFTSRETSVFPTPSPSPTTSASSGIGKVPQWGQVSTQ
ncbi:class iii chitinase 2 [Trichoderma arundinaceum]|uniref:Class iii chitinase 2 n=1 Tax=Trichoderma arundinaceum TaxID=490622 RepID=A0A395NX79_TRIAR|nr:class iii chitinase 2 [Trichoderma arundinaceum]